MEGKWRILYEIGRDEVVCSVCGEREDKYVHPDFGCGEWLVVGDSKFCPNCGAKMVGVVYEDSESESDFDDCDDIDYEFPCATCRYVDSSRRMSGNYPRCYRCSWQSEYVCGEILNRDYEYFSKLDFIDSDISKLEGVVMSLDGKSVALEYSDESIIVYVFSPRYGWRPVGKIRTVDELYTIGHAMEDINYVLESLDSYGKGELK